MVGGRPLAEGLKLVHGGALGFELYWREDVEPALSAGFRPPLLAGFTRFLSAPRARDIMDRIVADALKEEQSDPFDTHPPLPERLAALARLTQLAPGRSEDSRPAVQLLHATEQLEQALLLSLAVDPAKIAALVAIDWHEVGERIYPSIWAEAAQRVRPHLAGLTPGGLPDNPAFYQGFARQALGDQADGAPADTLVGYGAAQIAIAVSHQLVRAGWKARALPGEAVVFQEGETRLEPFTAILELARGRRRLERWREECAAAGIAEMDLGAAG